MGFIRGDGGGSQEGRFREGGGAGSGGLHAPKAKRWLILGSPNLPLPSL